MIVYRKCCRVWPINAMYPVGRCGFCGETPVTPASSEEVAEREEAMRGRPLRNCGYGHRGPCPAEDGR